jgi:hypothetical protein
MWMDYKYKIRKKCINYYDIIQRPINIQKNPDTMRNDENKPQGYK